MNACRSRFRFRARSPRSARSPRFAALLGIAILSLLVFSQAREIKRLREWAGRAPERASELEQRVSAEAAARIQRTGQPMPPRRGTGDSAQDTARERASVHGGERHRGGRCSRWRQPPEARRRRAAAAGQARAPAAGSPGAGRRLGQPPRRPVPPPGGPAAAASPQWPWRRGRGECASASLTVTGERRRREPRGRAPTQRVVRASRSERRGSTPALPRRLPPRHGPRGRRCARPCRRHPLRRRRRRVAPRAGRLHPRCRASPPRPRPKSARPGPRPPAPVAAAPPFALAGGRRHRPRRAGTLSLARTAPTGAGSAAAREWCRGSAARRATRREWPQVLQAGALGRSRDGDDRGGRDRRSCC